MNQRVVSIHYLLKNAQGEELDSSHGEAPLAYLEGAKQIIPALEEEVAKLSVGDKTQLTVVAKDAYGERDERYVLKVPKDDFGVEDIQVGDEFEAGEGDLQGQIFTIAEIADDHIVMDANHPLAGVDLYFDIEVVEIREATAEEIEHGHAHGEGGHVH